MNPAFQGCVGRAFVFRSIPLLAAAPLALLPIASMAQPYAPPGPPPYGAPAQPVYGTRQLDQLLAPIALYPDGVLSQILIAATYPEQVMQAAQWSRGNPGLEGDYAVEAAQGMGWHQSVQSLAAFPLVLMQMEQNFDWMRALGQAFIVQEPLVMDAVQDLRRRAQAAGTLRSDEQLRVEQYGLMLMIEPAQSQITYVPYYDPLVAYGTWPWAAYPPMYWAPWAGYRVRPGYRTGFAWGPGVRHSAPIGYSRIDWAQRRLHVPHQGAWVPFQRRADTPRPIIPTVYQNAVPSDARRDGLRFDSPRFDSPRFDSPRNDSPRLDSPRIDSQRLQVRRGTDPTTRSQTPASVARPAPSVVPGPTAPVAPPVRAAHAGDPRHDASHWQHRREERRLEAAPRFVPTVPTVPTVPSAAPPRAAPAAPAAPAAGPAPSQPREHGQGRGQRGDNANGGGRGEGRGRT